MLPGSSKVSEYCPGDSGESRASQQEAASLASYGMIKISTDPKTKLPVIQTDSLMFQSWDQVRWLINVLSANATEIWGPEGYPKKNAEKAAAQILKLVRSEAEEPPK